MLDVEQPKRSLRSIAMEKNAKKPAGEPKTDPNTGAPCPQDACKGTYKPTEGGFKSPGVGAKNTAGGSGT